MTLEGSETREAECLRCGRTFKQIGQHWRQSSCDYPSYSESQRELVKGLLMGDGSLSTCRGDRQSTMVVHSTQIQYLEWLDAQFGVLSRGIRLSQSGDEIAQNARDSGFDTSGGEWEYKDVYALGLRSHPMLTEMREQWYLDDGLRYPDDLRLSPTAALTWYCSDGGLSWNSDERVYVSFGTHNEADRPQFLCQLFQEHGFDASYSEPLIRFPALQTPEVLEWMGGPAPGYEYKWEYDSRDRYDELKTEVFG